MLLNSIEAVYLSRRHFLTTASVAAAATTRWPVSWLPTEVRKLSKLREIWTPKVAALLAAAAA